MKLYAAVTVLLAVPLLILAACAEPSGLKKAESSETAVSDTKSAVHRIDAQEAKQLIDEGGVTVVDVRTEEEYQAAHIPGSLLVPNETIGEEAEEKLPDKEAVLLVYCRTGVRSRQASDRLAELGYQNVYDFGGIADWPYETVSGTE